MSADAQSTADRTVIKLALFQNIFSSFCSVNFITWS